MIKKEDIDKAQENIHKLILLQAQNGAQSKVVQKVDPQLFALGQFIKDNDRNQRGIHGSASGLRVLADYDQNKNEVSGLVTYLNKRATVEASVEDISEKINDSNIIRDDNNIIKLSEILYALDFVKPAHIAIYDFSQSLAAKLHGAMAEYRIPNAGTNDPSVKGWDWYLDIEEVKREVHLLPSAFALLALAKNGFSDDSNVHKTILDKVQNDEVNDPASLAISVFALFVLIKTSKNIDGEKKQLRSILSKIWSSPHCSLVTEYEQNLEYWHNSHHEYARIPWQILLITITCKIDKWKFCTVNVQRMLSSLVEQAKKDGYKYPFSGPKVSTRTNAILYDCLEIVKNDLSSSLVYYLLIYKDFVIRFFTSKYAKIGAAAIMAFLMFFCLYEYYYLNKSNYKDYAIGFIVSLVFSGITFTRKK